MANHTPEKLNTLMPMPTVRITNMTKDTSIRARFVSVWRRGGAFAGRGKTKTVGCDKLRMQRRHTMAQLAMVCRRFAGHTLRFSCSIQAAKAI